MKSVTFEEVNLKIAEHQEEYETVHVQHIPELGTIGMCFELSPEEIQQIVVTGKIWYRQVIGSGQMQPMNLSVNKEVIILETEKIFLVCKSECENKPFKAEVGNTEHNFCCEKGFKKTLVEFTKSISKKECYKSGEECIHDCKGQCKESC